MASDFPFCRIPAVILVAIGILGNMSMLLHILHTRKHSCNLNPKPRLIITNLVVINIVLLIYICTHAVHLDGISIPSVIKVVHVVKLSLSMLQLGANITLGYDRYYCTVKPFKYRAERSLRFQWACIFINILISCLSGLVMGILSEVLSYPEMESGVIAISRFASCGVLCFLYIKISYRVRYRIAVQPHQVAISTQASKRSELAVKRLALGITISFAVFSLPIGIYNMFYRMNSDCKTFEGKLTLVCLTLQAANFFFDPIWYFYTMKRAAMKRRLIFFVQSIIHLISF